MTMTEPDGAVRFLDALGDGPLSFAAADDTQGRANWRPVAWSHSAATRRGALAHARESLSAADSLHVRPYHPKGQSDSPLGQCCVDLDDVAPDRLASLGLAPAAVVETSPGRYQAWIRFPAPLAEPDVTRLQTAVAEALGLEAGAKQALHAGRVPGYANRKPAHPDQPLVRLIAAPGTVADRAALDALIARVPAAPEPTPAPVRPMTRPAVRVNRTLSPVKSVQEFHADPKFGGDKSRGDMAWALYAQDRLGLTMAEVGAAIDAARQGDGKGRDYGARTAQKAAARLAADRSTRCR